GPFCLQLDDLHELGQGSAAEQLLAVAARAAPAGFHLVVTTRRPPGPPWARLLAEGMAVHVGVDDLVLDPAEAAALVVAEGARGWTPRALIAASRGWMLGARMLLRHGRACARALPDEAGMVDLIDAELLGALDPAEG